MVRYFWGRFKHSGSIDRLLMTITRERKCDIFHLLVHNEYQYAFKSVQMKVKAQLKRGAFVGHLNKKKSSSNQVLMKVLMENILAFNTETLCSQLFWDSLSTFWLTFTHRVHLYVVESGGELLTRWLFLCACSTCLLSWIYSRFVLDGRRWPNRPPTTQRSLKPLFFGQI